jgi:hypothetical protein
LIYFLLIFWLPQAALPQIPPPVMRVSFIQTKRLTKQSRCCSMHN